MGGRLTPAGPRTALARLAAGVGAAALVGAGACAARPYNPGHLAPGAIGRVSQICSSVMGLSPGEEHFDDCVESLSQSQLALDEGGGLEAARAACRARGLPPGSPEMAECELRLSRSAAAPSSFAPSATPEPVSGSSYFMTAPRDVYGREQLSCARLGLEPGGSGYQGCVASLSSALLSADIPAQ